VKAQRRGQKYSSTFSLTPVLDRAGQFTPHPGQLPLGRRPGTPLPIAHKTNWASGPVWTSAENIAPTEV